MPTLLSTKKLTLPQKQLLLNSGIGLVEYDAIAIKFLELPQDLELQKNLIFTSQNAVKAILPQLSKKVISDSKVFCVGEKTAGLLTKAGFDIVECEHYGADLAKKIIKSHSSGTFSFFCGKKRRDEIPQMLKNEEISFAEIQVYDTFLNKRSIKSEFDGILFFSPSGVKSFCLENKISGATAFCIGKTTAAEAAKHTLDIIIANKPTIENVIVGAVKHLKNR